MRRRPAQRLVQQFGELDPVTQRFLIASADTAASRWKEGPGIWEICGEPRDFLYSKLQCWAALDRAIDIAPSSAQHRVEERATARDETRAGEEGTFLLCTFWLVHAQALTDELDQGTATFERAVAAINDVGLLAGEVDVASGEEVLRARCEERPRS